MAKTSKPTKGSESKKIIFGVRRKGKYQKSKGPKDAPQKKRYRGQGR